MKELFTTLLYSNTFNFLILVAIFVIVLKKINAKQAFISMRDEIKNRVEKSENEKSLAHTELRKTEDELKELPKELEKIISDAKISAENISKDIDAKGKEELRKIEKQERKAIRFEEKKFNEKLASLTSTVAVDLAKNNAVEQLCKNPELHGKYIDEAIMGLDKVDF